jgi:pilus assembly protein Flp/PilA
MNSRSSGPAGADAHPERDLTMSGALAYLYTLVHVVHGRLELQRSAGRDDRGATAVEYGLLVGLIAAVIITVVATLGTKIAALLTSVSDKL